MNEWLKKQVCIYMYAKTHTLKKMYIVKNAVGNYKKRWNYVYICMQDTHTEKMYVVLNAVNYKKRRVTKLIHTHTYIVTFVNKPPKSISQEIGKKLASSH